MHSSNNTTIHQEVEIHPDPGPATLSSACCPTHVRQGSKAPPVLIPP